MDIFRILQKFAKRNKKFFLTFSCFVMAIVIELSATYVSRIGKEIHETAEQVQENAIKIDNIQTSVNFYNGIFRSVVTRTSFNDYIKHTDNRFKQSQIQIAEALKDMGVLDGRLTGLEKVVYALNFYEIKKNIPMKEIKHAK